MAIEESAFRSRIAEMELAIAELRVRLDTAADARVRDIEERSLGRLIDTHRILTNLYALAVHRGAVKK